MTQPRARVAAVGGARDVPAPDPIARDYLLLALRLDQHLPGLVDGYFGPADVKAQVDLEQRRPAAALRADAGVLRDRLPSEVSDPDRRRWLEAQIVALEAQARAVSGDPQPYLEHVAACFDWRPGRRPDSLFAGASAQLTALLPPGSPGATVAERLAAWDATLTIAPERLPSVAEWLVGVLRERSRAMFGLPPRESLRVGLVRNQPWTGYNWYDGGFRSSVDLNLDLPMRAGQLVRVLAHETYPGHHLEHAWKESERVEAHAQLEASILLINTPECLISEGLAEVGYRFASPPAGEADLFVELFMRAGLTIADDAARAADVAERQVAVSRATQTLREAAVNAAHMRHVDGASHDAVRTYLEDAALMTFEQAEKRLEFIEHPLWRSYVFVYSEGETLVRRWLELVPAAEEPARFGRLLHEPLTPSAIGNEIAAVPAG